MNYVLTAVYIVLIALTLTLTLELVTWVHMFHSIATKGL